MIESLAAGRRLLMTAACAAILYISLFWHLGAHSFWDPDEAHYAQTTQEMLARGDWLAPFYNGQPFYDKPIFFHWLQGAAMAVGGGGEAAARLPGAIAGVLLVALTGWIGARLVSPAVGWVSAVLLAVNPGLFGLARYAILDAPFTLCLFGGVSLLALAAIGSEAEKSDGAKRSRSTEWLGYLLIAGAVCIKGPVALALCAAALLIASLASRDVRQRLFALHWLVGVGLIVIVSAPWFVYMLLRFRQHFVDGYVLNENLRLFSAPLYANQPGWSFYLQILAIGFLPWTGLIIGQAFDLMRGRLRGTPRGDIVVTMLWSWVAAVTLFFSASHFKLDHYIFPVAPALCIIAARSWVDAQNGRAGSGARAGAASIGPVLILAGAAVAYLSLTRLDLPDSFLAVPGGIMLFGAGAIWQQRARQGLIPAFAVGALVSLYLGLVSIVLPALERGKVIPDLAHWVQTHAAADARVATFRLNRWNPAFRFYVARPVTMFDTDDAAKQFFDDDSPFYCVMTEEHFALLKQAGLPIDAVYRREGVWATSGRLLWRVKGQPTVFIVAKNRAGTRPKA